jgi:hypothetical protein
MPSLTAANRFPALPAPLREELLQAFANIESNFREGRGGNHLN